VRASNAPIPHQARIPGFVVGDLDQWSFAPVDRGLGTVAALGWDHLEKSFVRSCYGSETNVGAWIAVPCPAPANDLARDRAPVVVIGVRRRSDASVLCDSDAHIPQNNNAGMGGASFSFPLRS
jgi:hypothetical protein